MRDSLTPISDFIDDYIKKSPLRLHMPGHKGVIPEYAADITEVPGADSLFEPTGIISESEGTASSVFGAYTLYSTEGSSLCIRAMLRLAQLHALSCGKTPHILAARNAHRAFISGAVLLDLPVTFFGGTSSYLSCDIEPDALRTLLSQGEYTAVYITSPDYTGNIADISTVSDICHGAGVLLMVDNAHGAYLKFLSPSLHPSDLGADMCCDSAHKTLPVLTGGAYLHINTDAPSLLKSSAKAAMSLFASTSPSYLILCSLDRCNGTLADDFSAKVARTVSSLELLKKKLSQVGYTVVGDEAMKLTLAPKSYGYTGDALADILRRGGIEVEFSDPDHIVMMLSPFSGDGALALLEAALLAVEKRAPITETPPVLQVGAVTVPLRSAVLSLSEEVSVGDSVGRVAAELSVGCPPAVPVLIPGELIGEGHIPVLEYYGITRVRVIKSR